MMQGGFGTMIVACPGEIFNAEFLDIFRLRIHRLLPVPITPKPAAPNNRLRFRKRASI